jgi:hypothetical protein
VRLAIETQLEEAGDTSCSLIDLSQVTVLDFSCADEVVAKLLSRYLGDDRPRDAFFVFRGVAEQHREPVETVLERQGLAAVADRGGRCELLGVRSGLEEVVWSLVEERGRVPGGELPDVLQGDRDHEALEGLVRRRLVFRSAGGDVHALSRFVGDLPRG